MKSKSGLDVLRYELVFPGPLRDRWRYDATPHGLYAAKAQARRGGRVVAIVRKKLGDSPNLLTNGVNPIKTEEEAARWVRNHQLTIRCDWRPWMTRKLRWEAHVWNWHKCYGPTVAKAVEALRLRLEKEKP